MQEADIIRPAHHKAWRENKIADKTTSATKFILKIELFPIVPILFPIANRRRLILSEPICILQI